MHKDNFDSDETFNSIEDFLDKCCTYWNLTGNHTRNIYQAEFDGVDIVSELNNLLLKLKSSKCSLQQITGYQEFQFSIDSSFCSAYIENMEDYKEWIFENRYQSFQMEFGPCPVMEPNNFCPIYTFFFSFLLDTQDNYKIKAFSFDALLNCVRDFDDYKNGIDWVDMTEHLPKNFMDHEHEMFDEILRIGRQPIIEILTLSLKCLENDYAAMKYLNSREFARKLKLNLES
ncbi:hypothetical protein [Acinetobacter sp.]|uniref:hypothetical protein n=1 Tax=Acinetobacter sp. TaxID=472 RepID=UPI0028ACABFE|nr:hypothetical protein [Acinetobacter sp.]